jgi:16S rRNA (guanine(966)-N(2))-methyltransferase RsmD
MTDAGRVIAGTARGARLVGPGAGTRPLGDRAKQALFAIIEPDLVDRRVLDLFAGSGAAGIEALSRGASFVVFVERSGPACRIIDRNLRATGLAVDRTKVVRDDVLGYLTSPVGAAADGPFDVVLLDPPYADEVVRLSVLGRLGAVDGAPVVVDGGRVVTTHGRHHALPDSIGLLASERRKRFGETMLTFFRRGSVDGSG